MSQRHYQTPSEAPRPVVPLDSVLELLNLESRRIERDQALLAEEFERIPLPNLDTQATRRERALGSLAGRQEMLAGLQAGIITLSVDQTGKLDTPEFFED